MTRKVVRSRSSGSKYHRSAHHPVVARPSQSQHYSAVSDDLHQHGLRYRQSAGVPRHRLANLAGPRPGLKPRASWPTRGWKWRTCSAASARLSVSSMARRCQRRGSAPCSRSRVAAPPRSVVMSSGAAIAAISASRTTRALWAKLVMESQRAVLFEPTWVGRYFSPHYCTSLAGLSSSR
jgi:hypothetical protein